MTNIVRMRVSTFHPQVGSVRAGEVVEVPHELADHWTNNNIAEAADGQEVTRTTASEAPSGQDGPNSFGQWPEPAQLDKQGRAPAQPARTASTGNYSSMTSRADVGLAPDGSPTVAEPTSGPFESSAGDPNVDVPKAPDGSPTVGEPTSGPMSRDGSPKGKKSA